MYNDKQTWLKLGLLSIFFFCIQISNGNGQAGSSDVKANKTAVSPPPPPPPPPPPEEESWVNFEVGPIFPGCENLPQNELSDCTGEKIIEHIYKRLIYPADFDTTQTKCMAIVQFVVNADGSLSDFVLRRDPCEGCGEAALKAVKTLQELPAWTPARQRGRATKILYTMPVRFE